MAITTFAELRAAVHRDVHLSTDLFGERVNVQPAHGATREISAHVAHRQMEKEERETRDEVETLDVLISTEEDDETTGGIRDPQPGLLLWRGEAKDPDRRPFQFNGVILARHEHKLRLEFQRTKRTAQGAGIG